MINSEQQIAEFLMLFDGRIATFALELREYLIKMTKPKYELVGDSTISLNIGYGFTRKAWDCYCAIIVYSKHINISFPAGAFLSDPQKLLHGSGKKIRHLKIRSIDDLKVPAVKRIMADARNLAWSSVDEELQGEYHVETIFIPISGIKKRPKK